MLVFGPLRGRSRSQRTHEGRGLRRIEAECKRLPVLKSEPGLLAKLAGPEPSQRPEFDVDHGPCGPEGFASVGDHQACGALHCQLRLHGISPLVW